MNQITKTANAKINLALDILRKRPDGYHEVRMIMQSVRLHDRLTLRRCPGDRISLHTNLSFLPVNESNLVYQAIDLFRTRFQIQEGIEAILEKRIPVAAGLAGGSSDAAAALHGMNELFGVGCSVLELQSLGVKLGADVPYCLLGGTALSEGIGELLTPLSPAPACHCLIVKPPFNLSTRYVYEHLVLDGSIRHPEIDRMLQAVETQDFAMLCSNVGNVLEQVSIRKYPEIAEIKKTMLEAGACCSLMSGSGPSVFGLFSDKASADTACLLFKNSRYGKQTFLTTF